MSDVIEITQRELDKIELKLKEDIQQLIFDTRQKFIIPMEIDFKVGGNSGMVFFPSVELHYNAGKIKVIE